MDLSKKQKLINDIKDKLVTTIHPKSIYLFGSFARNEETSSSDIDILIETNTNESFPNRNIGIRRSLKGINFPFDIIIYTPQEILDKAQDKYSLVYKVLKEGIKLYEE